MSQYGLPIPGIAMAIVAAAAIYTAGVAPVSWAWRLLFLAVAVVAVGATVVIELMHQSDEFETRANRYLADWLDAREKEARGDGEK